MSWIIGIVGMAAPFIVAGIIADTAVEPTGGQLRKLWIGATLVFLAMPALGAGLWKGNGAALLFGVLALIIGILLMYFNGTSRSPSIPGDTGAP